MNDHSPIRPTTETLRNASASLRDETNQLRAGIANVLTLHAAQMGRRFLTPVDMRKADLCLAIIQAEQAPGETSGAEQFAPQAQPQIAAATVLRAVETAIADAAEPATEHAEAA